MTSAVVNGANTAGNTNYATAFSLSASSSGGYLRFETKGYGGNGCATGGCTSNDCNDADFT